MAISRLRVGSIVSWKHRGGSASGKIVKIVKDGKLKIPNSSLSLNATPEEPVALIRLLKEGELTKTLVGHKIKSLKATSNRKSACQSLL
jgi:hypothetical protein